MRMSIERIERRAKQESAKLAKIWKENRRENTPQKTQLKRERNTNKEEETEKWAQKKEEKSKRKNSKAMKLIKIGEQEWESRKN